MSVEVHGAKELRARLGKYTRRVEKDTKSILNQEARALAVEFGRNTLPGPGFSEESAEKFRDTVRGDVAAVYAVRSNPSAVYRMMLQHAPHLAGAYWRAVKTGKKRAAEDIVRRAKLPSSAAPGSLEAARTKKRGGVNRSMPPAALVRESDLRAIQKRQAAWVGFAKAAWYLAARSLGGRVRRGGGGRGTAEIFPGWVKKLARRVSGVGGSKTSGGKNDPAVAIFSAVKHAAAAMPQSLHASAVRNAQARVKKAMAEAMKFKESNR